MSFNISLYLTKESRDIEYPIVDPNKYRLLPMYNQKDWLDMIADSRNVMFSDNHDCREVAVNKGITYHKYVTTFGNLFASSLIILSGDNYFPSVFAPLVRKTLLNKYGCSLYPEGITDHTEIVANLNDGTFELAVRPHAWRVPWLSLLTYFVKYGEFLTDLAGYSPYEASLDDTVEAILDSWSGEVGFHTALGLWLFANDDANLIYGCETWYNGISSYLSNHLTIQYPDSVFNFIEHYGLNLDRVSKRFLDVHKLMVEAKGLNMPDWYTRGRSCNGDLSDSPEYMDYMGYDDYDDDYDDYDYDDDDNYDFEEEW